VKQVDVTLNVQPAGAGTIKISTIVPDSLPWTGVYFDGVPVTMTATENPGYHFDHWQSNILVPMHVESKSLTLNISSDDSFTAYFDKLEDSFEVFPNPFSDDITMTYSIPSRKQVSIRIYNSIGQLVAEPVSDSGFQEEGIHTVQLNGHSLDLSNGVYQVIMQSGDFKTAVKLVRAKTN
jgi:hypothetical protein